jgi:hypothetical protein
MVVAAASIAAWFGNIGTAGIDGRAIEGIKPVAAAAPPAGFGGIEIAGVQWHQGCSCCFNCYMVRWHQNDWD